MGPWLASRWNKPCARYDTTNVELEMRILNTTDPLAVLRRWKSEREHFEREVREYFADNRRFLEIDIRDAEAPSKISLLLGRRLDGSLWGHHKTNKASDEMRKRVDALGPCPAPPL